MAQSGYTPILIYASGTATNVPNASNMTSSTNGAELALNYADGKLYFKNSSGVVTLLANAATVAPVTTFSAGTTGFTPNTATSGAVTLSGVLNVANGGTGVTTSTGSGSNVLSTSPTLVTPILGTPTSVTLTNATGLPLSTGVTGTLATTNGGTGLTSFTANGVVYASSSSALSTGSALTFDGTNFTVTQSAWQFYVGANFAKVQNTTGTSASLVLADSIDSGTIKNIGSSIAFLNSSSEQMRLTTTGLGIGTTSPSAKLELSSSSAGATVEVLRLSNPGAGANTQAQIKFFTTSTNYGTISGGYGASAPQMTFNLPSASPGNYVWQISSTEQMRLDSSGNLLVGTTSTSGSVSNVQTIAGGIFKTASGSTSVANATATTLATLLNQGQAVYMVTAGIAAAGSPSLYSTVAIVSTQGTATNTTTIQTGTNIVLSMSGLNLQVTQTAGTTYSISWTILRIA